MVVFNEDEVSKSFQQRFSIVLNENGGNNSEFARKIGVSSSIITLYLNGKRKPNGIVLQNIARNYNVSIDWLLGLSEDRKLVAVKESTMPLSYAFAIKFSRLRTENNMSKIDFSKQYEKMTNQKNSLTIAATCEAGKSVPRIKILIITGQIFHVSIDYLLDLTDKKIK